MNMHTTHIYSIHTHIHAHTKRCFKEFRLGSPDFLLHRIYKYMQHKRLIYIYIYITHTYIKTNMHTKTKIKYINHMINILVAPKFCKGGNQYIYKPHGKHPSKTTT